MDRVLQVKVMNIRPNGDPRYVFIPTAILWYEYGYLILHAISDLILS